MQKILLRFTKQQNLFKNIIGFQWKRQLASIQNLTKLKTYQLKSTIIFDKTTDLKENSFNHEKTFPNIIP